MDDSSAGPTGQQMRRGSSLNVASESQIVLMCDLADMNREAYDQILAEVSAFEQPAPSDELVALMVEATVLSRRIAKHVRVDLRSKLGQGWDVIPARDVARSLLRNAA